VIILSQNSSKNNDAPVEEKREQNYNLRKNLGDNND
jgi:hypothetical protein